MCLTVLYLNGRMFRLSHVKVNTVSECLLFNANSPIFQLYHGENRLIFSEMMMRPSLYQTNTLSLFFYSASSPGRTVCGQTCRPTRKHYPDSQPTGLCSFSLMLLVYIRREATHTNVIVFGLTRSGFEPTNYHTGGVYDNLYTVDAVVGFRIEDIHFSTENILCCLILILLALFVCLLRCCQANKQINKILTNMKYF